MAASAKKTDPKLWDKVKDRITKGDKGGHAGQWSARKAQMAVQEYKKAGGGYEGRKTADNHLSQWTQEEWGTKSGQNSGKTGERYLPKQAREHLSDSEYRRTTAKKRADTAQGRQHSAQPRDIARKTAADRSGTATRAALLAEAAKHEIPGRSRMKKSELEQALRGRHE